MYVYASSVGAPFSMVCRTKHTFVSASSSKSVLGRSSAHLLETVIMLLAGFFLTIWSATLAASSPPYTTINWCTATATGTCACVDTMVVRWECNDNVCEWGWNDESSRIELIDFAARASSVIFIFGAKQTETQTQNVIIQYEWTWEHQRRWCPTYVPHRYPTYPTLPSLSTAPSHTTVEYYTVQYCRLFGTRNPCICIPLAH